MMVKGEQRSEKVKLNKKNFSLKSSSVVERIWYVFKTINLFIFKINTEKMV